MTLQPADSMATRDLRLLRDLYRALADPTRLRICAILGESGPLPVNELSSRFGLSQPLISWHLRILRTAGLVEMRPHGREKLCALRPAAFAALTAAQQRLVAGELRLAATQGLDAGGVLRVR
ncbi:MAG TPA: metalloregulator ArsR/SmtB family transcription factor [Pleomorphomonadaceae bacterium]|jgi:DNA-binding transcriptional ArsR family regulator|nr:metalloregulator ArsR/SmtB family transcription factor [Pleomorphomonadaceae bacterium]